MSGTALRERLRLLDELRQIVAAMRNLAYAELQRLGRAGAAQAKAEEVVASALASVVPAEDRAVERAPTQTVWLVIGAERGFCGGFNDQLAAALPELVEHDRGATWIIAGNRLRQLVEPLLPDAVWATGCSGAEESANCVDAWLALLASIETADHAHALGLQVMHGGEHGIARRRLLPLPELPPAAAGPAPMRLLPRAQLVPQLLSEMVRVGLLGALHQSMQQENRWRLMQMQRAQDYLDDAGKRLRSRYFRQRQSEITSELETLMSSFELKGVQRA